jgi:hypothetical protein
MLIAPPSVGLGSIKFSNMLGIIEVIIGCRRLERIEWNKHIDSLI